MKPEIEIQKQLTATTFKQLMQLRDSPVATKVATIAAMKWYLKSLSAMGVMSMGHIPMVRYFRKFVL